MGYDILIKPVLEKYAAMFGCAVTYDNRGTGYITIDGHDNSKTVMVSTHLEGLRSTTDLLIGYVLGA